MIREIRGTNTDFGYDYKIVDSIRFGTEGCVNKFCYIMSELLGRQLDLEFINIVTPRIPEAYTNQVFDLIVKLDEKYKINSIVINDLGLLYRLKMAGLSFNEIIIGRTLVRSVSYVPWGDYITRDESEEVKRNLLMINMYHKSKLELLKNFNVTGVELCFFPLIDEAIEYLHDNGFMVYVHDKSIIASIGRTCPIVRMNNCMASKCEGLCDNSLNIKLSKTWGVNKIMFQEPSDEVKKLYPNFLLHENVVYHFYNSSVSQESLEKADVIVYDKVINN